jgi:hypothetical protein
MGASKEAVSSGRPLVEPQFHPLRTSQIYSVEEELEGSVRLRAEDHFATLLLLWNALLPNNFKIGSVNAHL